MGSPQSILWVRGWQLIYGVACQSSLRTREDSPVLRLNRLRCGALQKSTKQRRGKYQLSAREESTLQKMQLSSCSQVHHSLASALHSQITGQTSLRKSQKIWIPGAQAKGSKKSQNSRGQCSGSSSSAVSRGLP